MASETLHATLWLERDAAFVGRGHNLYRHARVASGSQEPLREILRRSMSGLAIPALLRRGISLLLAWSEDGHYRALPPSSSRQRAASGIVGNIADT
jgi:hypothetical protein